jgi:lipoprotein-anchoring transpeptidase ErfK/SrfK
MDITRRSVIQALGAGTAATGLAVASAGSAAAAQPTLRRGSTGSAVRALQARLSSLGYWLGAVDGTFGDLTEQAVFAIQKASGVGRDGVVGTTTWAKVNAGVRPRVRSRSGHVIEIDKARQLLMVVDSGRLSRAFNTSTGSGQRYYSAGSWRIASTPAGSFRVFRQVNGWDKSPLGTLWRPKYFNGGIAFHGYGSVPPYPASHGCCRVSIPAMNLVWTTGTIPIGTRVLVY